MVRLPAAKKYHQAHKRDRTKSRHGDGDPNDPFSRTINPRLPDPECSIGVSFFGKLVSGWTNAGMPRSVTSNEGTGLRIERPQVLTGRPSAKVVGATSNDLNHWRIRSCSRIDRSCVHWNCGSTRHANKANSQRPNHCQNDTHRVSSFGDSVHPLENALFLVTV
jgi:hypothetical protein